MPTNRIQKARLLLDYFKVFMWPGIAVVMLIYLHLPIYNFVSNMKSFNIGSVGASSGGSTKSENLTDKTPHPDIWFSFQDISALSSGVCVTLGRTALEKSGFEGRADNQNGIVYGYKEGYVGSVNCSLQRVAVITVAGPYDGLSNRHKGLDDAFAGTLRGQ